jgi:hypothetical protein
LVLAAKTGGRVIAMLSRRSKLLMEKEEIEMSVRFIGNIGLGLVGAAVVVASQAFSATVTGWVMFGVSLAVVALLGAAQLDRGRGLVQRLLDAGTGALALWAVVASAVFSGATVTWLTFGEAIGFVGLAVIGLIAHELKTERVVHTFQAAPIESRDGHRAEELKATA